MALEPQGSDTSIAKKRAVYIELWQGSGLSRSEFCRLYGIQSKEFSEWINHHQNRSAKLLPITTMATTSSNHETDFTMTLPSGVSYRFTTSIEKVLEIIRGVESCI